MSSGVKIATAALLLALILIVTHTVVAIGTLAGPVRP